MEVLPRHYGPGYRFCVVFATRREIGFLLGWGINLD